MRRTFSICALLALTTAPLRSADRTIPFQKDIQPIFQKTCWNCHGVSVQLSKFSLATRDLALKGGEHGIAVVPGSAERSRLYRMVAGLEKPSMPLGATISPADVETFRLWIEQGVVWDAGTVVTTTQTDITQDNPIRPEERNYWAFQLPVRPAVPIATRNPIDAFIFSALEKQDIPHAPRADRTTLLRRAYLDLIGLPPTPAETAEFLNDQSPNAWEKLIDHLLASPHYGERWGRHWLDLARYADSQGFEHNYDRPNAWRYRD